MKATLCLAWLIIALPIATDCRGQEGEDKGARHVEKAGGFSFVPPEGWSAKELPGSKYKIVFGPAEGGFAPNIYVVDEAFDGTLDAYVAANKANFPKAFKKSRILKEEQFTPTSGLKGARLIMEIDHEGKTMRQSFYFFPAQNRFFVVTGTAPAEGGDRLDGVFEASLKTFRFEKQ